MKILIYGAGVIGSTYGWQLAESGHDISVLVRKGKKQPIEEKGINIRCMDFRNGTGTIKEAVFRPGAIETLSADNDFEYIIVTTNSLHLEEILPVLKESAGNAHILFFQNIWYDDLDKISKYLAPRQYLFGFPFMAGGGKDREGINTVISGSKYSKTMLGEPTGEITPRVREIARVMADAGMKPFVSNQIITWLLPHCAFIAALSAGIIRAGGKTEAFLRSPSIAKETIKAIREGFHVCSALGIDPKKEKVNKLYYLPLFICYPIVRKVFSDEAMQAMFDGYLANSQDEVGKMLKDIISSGGKQGLQTTYLKECERFPAENNRRQNT